ncbi:hypothetical protein P7K49_013325 [Saguinus oedipus]|uniref:Uncharacterized protein n=1 Tax=Saguinus oedipus TaxID=9490 RepID=A0ABQ9VG55_SAGOE|nr:hypothetical protein P7K49_013325 [Saguinus oedipus]
MEKSCRLGQAREVQVLEGWDVGPVSWPVPRIRSSPARSHLLGKSASNSLTLQSRTLSSLVVTAFTQGLSHALQGHPLKLPHLQLLHSSSRRPLSAHFDQMSGSGKTVSNVIIESHNSDNEEDDQFVVEAAPQLSEMSEIEMVAAVDLEEEKHGGLVKKILETKKDYEKLQQSLKPGEKVMK